MDLITEQIPLELVLIPAGEFMMGSPENEQGRDIYGRWTASYQGIDVEGPQHLVTMPSFFMGKYLVTQAQWRLVAALPQLKQRLELDPSHFKSNNHPVEQVNWNDAMEFCSRLQKHTGRPYRLPSEAEWEYACRAGTNTPFHFGTLIKTNVANYRGQDLNHEGKTYSGAYGDGPHGEFRKETTEVGRFPIPNAFGLYDMHGNVWEWCSDYWHKTYDGAPTDGSTWLSSGESRCRVLRGGSWLNHPEYCRSAVRYFNAPSYRLSSYGFRVVCGVTMNS
ncbi:MAG: formylglycine-generating enzyme family protein [Cyanobacteria bacterium P01_D01_bin.115]